MKKIILINVLALVGASLASAAAGALTLTEAAQKAVLNNPDVQARWQAFNSSVAEQDIARGGYFPQLDLIAGVGRESLTRPGQAEQDFTRRGYSANLSQMLFDGFATRSEVRRLGYAKLTRYYELLDASENAALEAARAYYDVLRRRKLVQLAEVNYAEHRVVFDQIAQRVQSGVGRRVDLEQAGGRLALAESNLLTEVTNLHDVSARYQRIVGELPPDDMAEPALLTQGMPANVREAIETAIRQSPLINAAIENIRAAQMAREGRNAPFMPRFDLQARKSLDYNRDGITGQHRDGVVEMVMRYNLFRGGADIAAQRRAAALLDQAKDLRDRACRDVRQQLVIAYNDTQRLVEQMRYLEAHQIAAEKTRNAYRQQFNIGQRSLLDLLDTENELFQARLAYANAFYDLGIAHARAHAAIGSLVAALNLRRIDVPSVAEMGEEQFEVDPATACPPEAPGMLQVDKAAVVAKAMAALPPPPAPAPVVVPAPSTAADEARIKQLVADWAAAWARKDVAAYLAFYAEDFTPARGLTRAQWLAQRRERLSRPAAIEVRLDEIQVRVAEDGATSVFRQHYRADGYTDTVQKTLHWRKHNDRWQITSEIATN